jgi:hypothetical protein
MKSKYLFILLALGFISCEGELVDNDENIEIKFPFEKLDQTNFNNASSSLNAPPSNVRLDSVVYIHYFRFNPETNSDDFNYKALKSSNAIPAPPEPTNRSSEHYHYNENKQLISKKIYSNYEYDAMDLTEKGELQFIEVFEYDSQNNLIRSTYQAINDSGTIINQEEFVYDNLKVLTKTISDQMVRRIMKQDDQLLIEYLSDTDQANLKDVYYLDQFNNISKFIQTQGTDYEYVNSFNYPKNIYNPFVNLFPKNFYPFLVLGGYQGGLSHISSGPTTNYYQQIQVNSQGFPEVIQSGSYDNGNRTLYYYSNY